MGEATCAFCDATEPLKTISGVGLVCDECERENFGPFDADPDEAWNLTYEEYDQ